MSRRASKDKSQPGPHLSRRGFVQLSLSALVAWLTGCQTADPTATLAPTLPPPAPSPTPVPPTATATVPPPPTATAGPLPPTYTPVPSLTVPATEPPPPTASPSATPAPALSRAELSAHWPTTETSRVVLVRHGGVWTGAEPDPEVVLTMLDAGLRTLTDEPDVLTVWQTLFDPDERVLLKVNCIAYNGPTQPAVTYAVAQRLQEAGLPSENVLIFDRTDNELQAAGYTLNQDGPGVRCHGPSGKGTEAKLTQASVRFYQEFDAYDAIINLPTPKQHGGAGISVSLKNHYGSIDHPGSLHGNWCDPAIAELNAQPTLRHKTRLIVGAALNVSPCDWNQPERENALLLSFDPVALDTVARDLLVRQRQEMGLSATHLVEGARHLNTAQELALGTSDPERIDLREVTLG